MTDLAPTVPEVAASPDAKATTKKKRKAQENAVRLTRVTKRFGEKVAVDELTLQIASGTVYGLIGPNGAGKTTTFSMLAGFLQPTDGQVEVLGFAPHQVDELRGRIGVLPQDALLPAYDQVGEFLTHMAELQGIPRSKAKAKAREALVEVEGKDWWRQRCGALSHGMAKRVQLAQALLGDPEVVLLDEPTAGLDPRVAYEVRQLIKSRKGRCTLVVSSHNLQELEEICDSAAILDRGRLIAFGTISELTSASEEVHFKVTPGPAVAAGPGAPARTGKLPLDEIRALPMVKRAEVDDERGELIVHFERGQVEAEAVIEAVLWVLLNTRTRISGITKGRGLEQRVMDLT